MLGKLPLQEKLVLYFILLGTIIVAALGTFSYTISRSALLSRTFNQLTSVRTLRSQQLEAFFRDREREATAIAASEETKRSIVQWIAGEDPGFFLSTFIRQPLPSTDYVSHVLLLDPQGRVTMALRILQDSAGLWTGPRSMTILPELTRPGVHDYVELERGSLFLSISAPTLSGHTLVLAIPSRAIDRIMLESDPLKGLGNTGECYLVGPDGLMRSTSRFYQPSILITGVNTAAAASASKGNSGITTTTDYRGIKVMSSFGAVHIRGLDWVILAEIDEQEAMQPILQLRDSILMLSILIALGMFILAYFSARWLVRPLRQLADAARRIGQGDFNTRVVARGGDEIAHLGVSFNTMAQTLQHQTMELENARNRQVELTIDGQEQERQRLSRELHDGIGQSLVALKLKLEQIDPRNTCGSAATLKVAKDSLDEAIEDIRRITHDLMPAGLQVVGLLPALRKLCADTEAASPIRIELQADKLRHAYTSRTQTYIYRIVQEALNNIVKHAAASQAWISFKESPEALTVWIKDDGRGMDDPASDEGKGHGLFNMKERSRILGGTLHIDSGSGKGTSVGIHLPIVSRTP